MDKIKEILKSNIVIEEYEVGDLDHPMKISTEHLDIDKAAKQIADLYKNMVEITPEEAEHWLLAIKEEIHMTEQCPVCYNIIAKLKLLVSNEN